MKIFQKGFNYSQDGEGNRLVYHLQGCNMKCPWCANPEGMSREGALIADAEWLLDSICPRGAISEGEVDREKCRQCKTKECITLHDTKGMYLSFWEQTPEEIVREALDNEMMFYDGGGVTFTGGEATLQFEELKEVLKNLKEYGIHTALETNGADRRIPELFPYIDQLIMDCKHMDEEKHREYTGIPGHVVLRNLRRAAAEHPKLHVRVPMIGQVNDSQRDRDAFVEFFREIQGDNVTFEVLAYHEFGKKKWQQCGLKYRMTQDAYVKDETLRDFRERIIKTGARYQRT